MTDCVDCKKLPGHLRDICEGTDDLSSVDRDKYVRAWLASGRLTAIECSSDTMPIDSLKRKAGKRHRNVVTKNTGPGTELTKSLKWIEKIKPATATCNCANLAKEMNTDGVKKCRERRDEYYLPAMMENKTAISEAMKAEHNWRGPIGMALGLVPDAVVVPWIRGKFDAACAAAERVKPKSRQSKRLPRKHRPLTKEEKGEPLPPFPFTETPQLSLVFHCWPKVGGWERHVEQIKKIEHRFSRKMMGISLGPGCVPAATVREAFGSSWEYHEFRNSKKLGEVPTLQWAIDQLPTGPNDVTFYCHSKGTKDDTMRSEAVVWWTDAMYETVIHNVDPVLSLLESGAAFVGSFRYSARAIPTHSSWHFSGTYYAFRNAVVLNNQKTVRPHYYGTEAFPGDCVPVAQSACVFNERELGHAFLYQADKQPRKQLEEWRAQRGVISESD